MGQVWGKKPCSSVLSMSPCLFPLLRPSEVTGESRTSILLRQNGSFEKHPWVRGDQRQRLSRSWESAEPESPPPVRGRMTPQFLSQCPICMATMRESQSQAGSMKTWMWELLVPSPSTGSEKRALGFCLFRFETKAQVALTGLGLNRYVAENTFISLQLPSAGMAGVGRGAWFMRCWATRSSNQATFPAPFPVLALFCFCSSVD